MADKGKYEFPESSQMPVSESVSPLANNDFGPKADWPNATMTPQDKSGGREGTGNNWFTEGRGKGANDFSSSTSIDLPSAGTTERVRPKSTPPGWEK